MGAELALALRRCDGRAKREPRRRESLLDRRDANMKGLRAEFEKACGEPLPLDQTRETLDRHR